MRLDYYTRFAENLFCNHVENPDNTEWRDVLSWLEDAPENAPDSVMLLWTELLLIVLNDNTNFNTTYPEFVSCVTGYFDRVAALPATDFVKTTAFDAFESLMREFHPTADGAHPCTKALVDSGWNPIKFLDTIAANETSVLAANRTKRGYNVPLSDTGAGGFIRTLHPLFWTGEWKPEPNPTYALLFETYVISQAFNAEPDSQFIRNVLDASPGQAYKALWCVRRQEYVEETHLKALFPLPLIQENAQYMLAELMELLVDEPKAAKGKTMPLVKEHHPELASLLEMHCSLFSDATPGKTYSDFLVEPYLRMIGSAPDVKVEMVDISIFEDKHDAY